MWKRISGITRNLVFKKSPTSSMVINVREGSGRKVGKHKKPRWIPPAPSKLFVLPPKDHTPESEIEMYKALWIEYKDRLGAVSQYLYEEHLKNSEVGEEAKIQAALEIQDQDRLIEENEKENESVRLIRQDRLDKESREEELQITRKKEEFLTFEEDRLRKADEIVRMESIELENRVKLEALTIEIEKALDNPVDYEYAIDKEGHIYRGRYTKTTLVPPEQREKIPVPEKPGVFLEEKFN